MQLRESVILFAKKHNKCTCQLCRKIITQNHFVCKNCFKQMTVLPFLNFKLKKESSFVQIQQSTRTKIKEITEGKSNIYHEYAQMISKRSKVKILQENVQKLRKRKQALDVEKKTIQQFIQKRKSKIKQLSSIVRDLQINHQQFQTECFFQQKSKRQKVNQLTQTKINLINQFKQLQSLLTSNQQLNLIQCTRKQIPMISQDNSENIMIDSFKFQTNNPLIQTKLKWIIKMLIIKLHLTGKILNIQFPYSTMITQLGQLALGSKVVSGVGRNNINDEILELIQFNIEYLYSIGGIEKEKKFYLSAEHLQNILKRRNGFGESEKSWKSYYYGARLIIIFEDKEVCRNMEEEGEILELEDPTQIFSIPSSEEQGERLKDI